MYRDTFQSNVYSEGIRAIESLRNYEPERAEKLQNELRRAYQGLSSLDGNSNLIFLFRKVVDIKEELRTSSGRK